MRRPILLAVCIFLWVAWTAIDIIHGFFSDAAIAKSLLPAEALAVLRIESATLEGFFCILLAWFMWQGQKWARSATVLTMGMALCYGLLDWHTPTLKLLSLIALGGILYLPQVDQYFNQHTPVPLNKSRTTALVLGFFLAPWGVHRYYLGLYKTGLCQLGLLIGGIASLALALMHVQMPWMLALSGTCFYALGYWTLIDLLRIWHREF